MKTLAVVCLLVVGALAVKLEHDGQFYDMVDVMKLLESEERRNASFACLLEGGPCTGENELVIEAVPRILKTKCGDCNAEQKATFEKSVEYLKKNHPDIYKKMLEKYGS